MNIKKNYRKCIYPKDVQLITGKSLSTCSRLLRRIKKVLKKADHQYVSVREFCAFTGLREEEVEEVL